MNTVSGRCKFRTGETCLKTTIMDKDSANTRREQNVKEYHLVPMRYPKGAGAGNWSSAHTRVNPQVPGWVDMSRMIGASRRRVTEGYLNQRMNRENNIATNQAYVTRIVENPRTPKENRDAVIEYVRKHPDKFTPVADYPEDERYQEWAVKHNGNARKGFVREFLSRYEVI